MLVTVLNQEKRMEQEIDRDNHMVLRNSRCVQAQQRETFLTRVLRHLQPSENENERVKVGENEEPDGVGELEREVEQVKPEADSPGSLKAKTITAPTEMASDDEKGLVAPPVTEAQEEAASAREKEHCPGSTERKGDSGCKSPSPQASTTLPPSLCRSVHHPKEAETTLPPSLSPSVHHLSTDEVLVKGDAGKARVDGEGGASSVSSPQPPSSGPLAAQATPSPIPAEIRTFPGLPVDIGSVPRPYRLHACCMERCVCMCM